MKARTAKGRGGEGEGRGGVITTIHKQDESPDSQGGILPPGGSPSSVVISIPSSPPIPKLIQQWNKGVIKSIVPYGHHAPGHHAPLWKWLDCPMVSGLHPIWTNTPSIGGTQDPHVSLTHPPQTGTQAWHLHGTKEPKASLECKLSQISHMKAYETSYHKLLTPPSRIRYGRNTSRIGPSTATRSGGTRDVTLAAASGWTGTGGSGYTDGVTGGTSTGSTRGDTMAGKADTWSSSSSNLNPSHPEVRH